MCGHLLHPFPFPMSSMLATFSIAVVLSVVVQVLPAALGQCLGGGNLDALGIFIRWGHLVGRVRSAKTIYLKKEFRFNLPHLIYACIFSIPMQF